MPDDLYSALKYIASCDPDGFEREPTEADHLAHKRWAIANYGRRTWAIYNHDTWDQEGGTCPDCDTPVGGRGTYCKRCR